MLKAICPKKPRLHETFIVSAHVVQEWLVDMNGEYTKTRKECTDVTHAPGVDDVWTCAECGEVAQLRDSA